MNATWFQPLTALVNVVKRLRFVRGKKARGRRKGRSTPPKASKTHNRHSAFFRLP